MGLHLAQKQLELGRSASVDQTLEKVLAEFQSIEDDLNARQSEQLEPQTRRALLVEDDANESELLAGFLRLSGFAVDTAVDGCDALGYLAAHKQPDVVLLDMQIGQIEASIRFFIRMHFSTEYGPATFGLTHHEIVERQSINAVRGDPPLV